MSLGESAQVGVRQLHEHDANPRGPHLVFDDDASSASVGPLDLARATANGDTP